MASYSCTNQRYEFAPLRVEIIDVLPAGTLLFRESSQKTPKGNPISFTLEPTPYSDELYMTQDNLPYVIGLPQDNPIDGLCWECRPDEEICFDDNLDVEFPHPCAWWQDPYFYFCNLDGIRRLPVPY